MPKKDKETPQFPEIPPKDKTMNNRFNDDNNIHSWKLDLAIVATIAIIQLAIVYLR